MEFVNRQNLDELIKQAEQNDLEAEIISFIKSNPNPEDAKVHNLAIKFNMDPDVFEEIIYSLLTDYIKNGIRASEWEGNGKDITRDRVDPEEFRLGEIVESEHTKNPAIRERIILDHLYDNDKYYSEGKAGNLHLEELSTKDDMK